MKADGLRLFFFVCALAAFPARADVTIQNAWIRGTVAAQTSTGAFMTITSREDAKLVGAKAAIADMAEIHLSSVSNGVNHMRPVDIVALPAGKAVELKPGGYHLMLMGLSKPAKAGDSIPITLTVEDMRGKRSTVQVKAEVRALGQ